MSGIGIFAILLNIIPFLAMLALTIYVIILFSRLVNAVEKIANKQNNDSNKDTNQL
jgi:hypothetical protein